MKHHLMFQPASERPAASDPHFAQLCSALDAGWNVEPPVYLRYQWFGRNEQGYYFILKRGADVDLIVVTNCETIRQWVRERRLRVIVD